MASEAIAQFLGKLKGVKKSGDGYKALCPAHNDSNPSLSIHEGDDGRVLVKCHADCRTEEVVSAIGLSMADLAPPQPSINGKRRIAEHYDYCDEHGETLFQVVRYDPKDFRQRSPKPGGGWNWSVKGTRVVPYRLPELLTDPTQIVIVVEGEKDADNVANLGFVTTCNAGGAGKWRKDHALYLRGRKVVLLPDNDDAGRAHAQKVARSLEGIAEWIRIVELPQQPDNADPSDWIKAGGTKKQLDSLIESAANWSDSDSLEDWPDLIPFDDLNLPQFPTHALPKELQEWVAAKSHATQTPADLAGLLGLAVCSAAIARRVVVQARTDWREPVNIFVAVLLEPGNRKSAVFADALRPLREIEAELIEDARPTVAREQSERRQNEARLRKLEKTAAEKCDAEASQEAGELASRMASDLEPVLPRLIVDDATSEKIGIMLAEQGGRLASMSPEGGVFDLMAGLYSKSGIPQFGVYLMGHSGDDLTTDRISRQSVRVEKPALTCAYTIQPAVLDRLRGNPAFRGRGLLARFFYAAPQSWIGRRKIAPAPVPEDIDRSYGNLVRTLAQIDEECILQLSSDAAATFQSWEAEIEQMLGDGGELEAVRDWGAKLAGATLRLAGILHCVEFGPHGKISRQTIAAAIEIARYLLPHAQAVLRMMDADDGSASSDAEYVVRWIERHGCSEFSKRQAQHHGKRRFPRATDIDPALEELIRRGYIRPRPVDTSGPGRPPSPTYEVNPAAAASFCNPRSHNSHNSVEPDANSDCGNIGSASEALARDAATGGWAEEGEL